MAHCPPRPAQGKGPREVHLGGFLLIPDPDDQSLAQLRRKLRLLCLRRLLLLPQSATLRAAWEELARRQPEALLRWLEDPDLQPALLAADQGLLSPAEAAAQVLPRLLCALARERLITAPLLWTGPLQQLIDPAAGLAWELPPCTALLALPGALELQLAAGPRLPLPDRPEPFPGAAARRVRHALRPELHLSLWDSCPLSHVEAHPEKSGNALDLGEASLEQWLAALDAALGLLEELLPDWARERAACQRRLLPVGTHAERHNSCSYREAPGLCWLSLHPDPLTMAEALLHEAQHSKLNSLLLFDPVLHNGQSAHTRSPVRPDLRPLQGVLLAVHAFVPVAELHRRIAESDHPLSRRPGFAERRAQVLSGDRWGLDQLQRLGQPTALGRRLLADLAGHLRDLSPVGETAQDLLPEH